jgi:hypothetical protein
VNRIAAGLVWIALLTGCAFRLDTLEQDITRAAQERLENLVASHYTRALSKGVRVVVNELSRPGGYLDNPLVRILLPPPVMLVLDIARELHAEPQAGALDVLINRAAEHAIPGAAPILQAAVAQLTIPDTRELLDAGTTAGTDYLEDKTSDALQEALSPLIASALETNGARLLYMQLFESQAEPLPPQAVPEIAIDETPGAVPTFEEFEQYVTQEAIDGLFKAMAAEELSIRDELERLRQQLFDGRWG